LNIVFATAILSLISSVHRASFVTMLFVTYLKKTVSQWGSTSAIYRLQGSLWISYKARFV